MKVKLITFAVGLLVMSSSVFAQSRVSAKNALTQAENAKKQEQQMVMQDKHETAGSASTSASSKAAWDELFTFNALAAAQVGVETNGIHFYTCQWNSTSFQRYNMDGTGGVAFTVAGAGNVRDMAYDGQYFYGSASNMTIYKMDLEAGTLIGTIPVTCAGVTGVRHIAYDPTLDGGNGGFWVGNWNELGAISMTGAQLVASAAGRVTSGYGSAYDPYSTPSNPRLLIFQQTGGSTMEIHGFDINTMTPQGLVFDAATVTGAVTGSLAGGLCIYEDNTSGLAVVAGNIQQDPNLVFGLELFTLADPNAPAASTNMSAVAGAMGALNAMVSWTNPTVTVAGTPLTSITSVNLYLNDNTTPIFTTTTSTIGSLMNYNATGLTAGNNTFKVIANNAAGAGLPASITVFVGEDVPAAPGSVVLSKTGMTANLAWTAPTVGVNGGYISSALTYTVTRYPGATVVATNITALTFTEVLTMPGEYSYTVTASSTAGAGGTGTSNTVTFGDFMLYQMFNNAGIPTGWAAQGLGLTNWSVVTTSNAGGAANELRLNWSPSFTGISYFVSPVINTAGTNTLTLNYKDMLDDYNTNVKTIGVKSTIDGGATWNTINAETMTNGNVNVGPRDNSFTITSANNSHVGSPNFQLAFFFDGYTFDIDYWYIDNVTLTGIMLPGADVTFNVTSGGVAVEGATVTVAGVNYTTNASGAVTVYVLEGTNIPYSVTKFGYQIVNGTIPSVVNGVPQTIPVNLPASPQYTVTFNIQNAISQPLNALVTMYLDGNVMHTGTAAAGTIAFTTVLAGNYTYDVVMEGYVASTGTALAVSANATVPVTLTEIMVAPSGLDVDVTGNDALFTWSGTPVLTPVELVQHQGVGADGGYYQQYGLGYGVIFDLSDYPDAIIDAVDYHHVSWGTMGTWNYKFHVANITNTVLAHTTPMIQTTGNDTWEEGIDLGQVEGLGGKQVGIFLESFSNSPTDAYPCMNTDGDGPNGASYFGVDLTTFVGTITSADAGDFIMDLWILTADGKRVKAPKRVVAPAPEKVLVSYTVYLDGVVEATGVTEEQYLFEGLDAGDYTAGVKAIYSTGETEMVTIDFEIIDGFVVTYSVDEGQGTISATANGVAFTSGSVVAEGSLVLFTAVPATDWVVKDWIYNGASTGLTGLSVQIASLAGIADVKVQFKPDGINEASAANLNVYPNPSKGEFNVTVDGTYDVTVMSMTGKVVYTGKITDKGMINLASQGAGVYFLQLKSDSKVINQRIVVK